MLLIVIVAFVATVSFFRRAKEIGLHPGKTASVPFIAAGAMIATTYISAVGMGRFFATIGVSADIAGWIGFSMDWFLILAYLVFIKRNWDILSTRQLSDPSTSEILANANASE